MDPKNERRAAIGRALDRWESAPAHIRIMAGAYVGPLLEAVAAIERDLEDIRAQLAQLKGEA